MTFDPICHSNHPTLFTLDHNGNLPISLEWFIYNLLYRENLNSSFQAKKNKILSERNIDENLFILLMHHLVDDVEIDVSTDKTLRDINGEVQTSLYYNKEVCKNCSKIIFFNYNSKLSYQNFFNHLRNSLAHGRFNYDGNFIIFLDITPSKEYSAFYKFKFDSFKSFSKSKNLIFEEIKNIEKLNPTITKKDKVEKIKEAILNQKIIMEIFKAAGHSVESDTDKITLVDSSQSIHFYNKSIDNYLNQANYPMEEFSKDIFLELDNYIEQLQIDFSHKNTIIIKNFNIPVDKVKSIFENKNIEIISKKSIPSYLRGIKHI